MKNKIYVLLVIAVVVVLHLWLGWCIHQLSIRPPLMPQSFANQLQMVEVNLGMPPSSIADESIVPDPTVSLTEPEPEISVEPELSTDPILAVEQTQLADVVQPKVVKPIVRNVEPIKPKTPPKPKIKPTEKPKKTPQSQKTQKEAKPTASKTKVVAKNGQVKSKSGNLSQERQGEVGDMRGKAESPSTKGNSAVSASLGAGYGNAMRGQCSDLSDSEEDAGQVKLMVQIDERGKATSVSVVTSSGIKRLDNQAKRMALGHRFQAGKINGKAVASSLVFTIHFTCGV